MTSRLRGSLPWRSVVAIALGTTLAVSVAGCGDDEPIDDAARKQRASIVAHIGPRCDALRAAKDPGQKAYAPTIAYVYDRGGTEAGARYASLTLGQRLLWATRRMEDEVANGGFNQYFFNSSGATLADAIRGYKKFGAARHLRLARRAGELYAKDKERLAGAKAEGTLDAFMNSYDEEPYHALDQQFYDLEPPRGRLAYLRAHLREFCVP